MTSSARTSTAAVVATPPMPVSPAVPQHGGTRPSAPQVGPQWFPAVMGTGILATCTEQLARFAPVLHGAAVLWLVLAWTVLALVGTTFARRALRHPDRFRATVVDLTVLPFYGTLAMGLLAVGSATLVVAERHAPTAAPAAAWVLWTAGTSLGVLTAVGYPLRLLAAPGERGAPTPVWALPVVPPMVSAAGGAVLAGTLPPGGARAMLLLCGALFLLALFLGAPVLLAAYAHLARGQALPLQGSPAIWIPLGVAGQSTAAANFSLAAAQGLLPPAALAALHGPVAAYSAVALGLGAAAGAVALRVTVGALRRGMTFGPGWWSFTFPVGAMGLGAVACGTTLDVPWLVAVSAVLCACLVGTVGLCVVGSVRCWHRGRA